MKNNIQKNVLFIACLLFFFTTCKSDDEGIVDAGFGKVLASVDGTNWESKDEASGAVFASSLGSNTIQAHADDGSTINMILAGTLSSGLTLNSDNGLFQASYKPDVQGTDLFSGIGLGSGTTTVTTFSSSKIKGTFQFTGVKTNADGTTEEKVISSGIYDIDY